MKTILIKEGCPNPVALGEKGENGVSAVLLDYSEWISDFGEGAISLLVKRKGDQSAYPVVLSTADGIATWTISDVDTAVQGYGKAEYIFTIDDKVAKSAVFSFFVAHDLGPAGDPPDPYESWIDTLTALGGETLINAQAAEAAQSGAETAQTAAETAATNAATSATNAAQSAGAARDMAASALSSADRATASATAASGHATAAETAKDLAISAAEDAQHSETQAELSASAAAESAESASGSATTATTAATNASASASSASASATAASGSASSASASATTATQAATSATTSAQNASASASAASGSATAAASSETNAAASAERAETAAASVSAIQLPVDTASGSIASFPDGADSVPLEALSVALEPIQDLHGQSAPYPAGGGPNVLNPSTIVSEERYELTDEQTIKVLVSDGRAWANIDPIPLSAGTYYVRVFGQTTYGQVRTSEDDYASAVTLNGESQGSFTLSSDGGIKIKLELASTYPKTVKPIISKASISAWSPYSNICPITGHTQAQVWRAGVNVWDEEWRLASLNITTGVWSSIGTYSQIASANMIPVKPNTTYYFASPNDGGAYMAEYRADGSYIGYAFTRAENRAFTTPSDCAFVMFQMNGYGSTYNNDISINYPSTDHDYHAHSIANISIPLGQTVYGGTLDVLNGVLTVDRAMVDLGDLSWSYASGSSFNLRSTTDIGALPPATTAITPNAISSIYPVLSYLGVADADKTMTIVFATSGQKGKVWVHDTSYSDAETFKSAVTGQQLVYELATPIEIPLTPEQLSTLYGTNNVWSDSGDVSVTYRADIGLYIQKMIAEALT